MKRQSPTLTATASAAALLLTIVASYDPPPSHEPWAQERLLAADAGMTAKARTAPAAPARHTLPQRTAHTIRSQMLMVGIGY